MPPSTSIFRVYPIDLKLFFTVSDYELFRQICNEFPQELERLNRAYSIKSLNNSNPLKPSPSQSIYGTQYNEVDRTLISVLSLRWIYHDEYEIFTSNHPDETKLTRSTFNWVRGIFMEKIEDPEDLYSLLTYIMINDLGKDAQLASDYQSKTGIDVSTLNHDMILLKAIEAGIVPSIGRLSQDRREGIMRGIKLNAGFNAGQLAQAENAPASLSVLLLIQGHYDDFQFYFREQLLDVAGAAGHEDWTCAKKLNEPIAQAYKNVYDVASEIIFGSRGLRDAYDVILTKRGALLYTKGFKFLDVHCRHHRALLRLLCMGGVTDVETAGLYLSVWEGLDKDTQDSLVYTLNIDGSLDEPAVQPTYMPAMFAQGIGKADLTSQETRRRCLHFIIRYLSRVMVLQGEDHSSGKVIERSVLWVVKDIVQSRKFQDDPAILERIQVPNGISAIP